MNLRQLRYFLTIAQTGSLSKASALLAVSQPALSRHIQSIEEEFGMPLLYRHGRGIALTEAGTHLQVHAQEILDNLERMRLEMQSLRETPTGHVIIGIPPMIGQLLTVPLVRSFREKFPNISLQIAEGLSGHVHEWLTMGRIDMAIVYTSPQKSPLMLEPLLEDELYLFGTEDPPGAGDDGTVPLSVVEHLPLILPSRPHGLRAIVDAAAAKRSITANVDLEVDSLYGMIQLVEAGLGYTVLPLIAVKPLVEAKRVRPWRLVDPPVAGMLALAASSQRPKTPATKYLSDTVRAQVRHLVASGIWSQSSKYVERDQDAEGAAGEAPEFSGDDAAPRG